MYREPADPAPATPPPSELVFEGLERTKGGSGIAVLQVFSLPVVVGVALSMIFTPTVGLVGLVASLVGLLVYARRKPGTRVVLRVTDGALHLTSMRGKALAEALPLKELLDVAVDTKEIQPIQDGASAVPALRVLQSQASPAVDVARLVIVFADREPFVLTPEHIAHMDAMEWLGKIRVFLRKNGWVPADERAAEAD